MSVEENIKQRFREARAKLDAEQKEAQAQFDSAVAVIREKALRKLTAP